MSPSYWILRHEHRLLTLADAAVFPMLDVSPCPEAGEGVLVGEWQGTPCRALDLAALPDYGSPLLGLPLSLTPLRELYSLGGEAAFALAGRAVQLLDWQNQHRFCGQCGTSTVGLPGESAMQCPACGLVAYPRISPAIMVLVRDGERLLLARSPRFKPGVYSALAGFVEAGESLEQCAAREVREEVGIEIANLRYFSSQSWPFPNSLMVAFFADYAGGELQLDPVEIEDARWCTVDDLPLLPDRLSISRRLIEAALADLRG